MAVPIPAPRPITTEEREFIATVENTMRPAFLAEVAREFADGQPADGIVERMSAAAPGHRLQTAVQANIDAHRHLDALPADERSAAAEQAALVVARTVSQLTVQTANGRLGDLVGQGADHLLRGQYKDLAQQAAGQAGLVLGGAAGRAHLLQVELADIRRQAGAGLTPPGAPPRSTSGAAEDVAAKPADRTKATRGQLRH
ncbi:hypothetical protein [Kribbella sp. VKM Ac-2566]|uniref:hypothetical protein n=1 Tax=Kribbella sp. VKM Ac-2566 TaxID=2512218 RepID=UPI00106412D3|nr:hypothetical protein [Kribbella sp. VKM Ac-2566]TDX02576.1 hypothetical protein EV647_0791 [Kribbella sp. VKM Ac-2566]